MIAKFLFGTNFVIKEGGDVTDRSIQDMLVMVRKHDIFQHLDMADFCQLCPSTGGFVKRLRSPGEEHFYGESLSCRVQTDESMNELYHDLIEKGSWFKCTYQENKKSPPFTVFCGIPKGHIPCAPIHRILKDITWDPIEYKDVYRLMDEEIQASHY